MICFSIIVKSREKFQLNLVWFSIYRPSINKEFMRHENFKFEWIGFVSSPFAYFRQESKPRLVLLTINAGEFVEEERRFEFSYDDCGRENFILWGKFPKFEIVKYLIIYKIELPKIKICHEWFCVIFEKLK